MTKLLCPKGDDGDDNAIGRISGLTSILIGI